MYDPKEFFSAERYPLPITCGACGHTMRPVHKHYVPDLPRTYFCTFCGAGFYEDNPGIRFNKPKTNADRIRQMSDEELAESLVGCPATNIDCGNYLVDGKLDCKTCWLDWLKSPAEGT